MGERAASGRSEDGGDARTAEFAVLAGEYRALIEGVRSSSAPVFLRACASLLPRIYAAALELPPSEPGDFEPLALELQSPARSLEALLGEDEVYWEVFDPTERSEPLAASISDDLADVYLDLVRPLLAFERGRVDDAAWEWRLGFESHWGDHLVDALRAIHRRLLADPPDSAVGGECEG